MRFVLVVAAVLSLSLAVAANASAYRTISGLVYEGSPSSPLYVNGATVDLYQDGHYVSRVTTPHCGFSPCPTGAFRFLNASVNHWYQVEAYYQGGCYFHYGWSGEQYMNGTGNDLSFGVRLTNILRLC